MNFTLSELPEHRFEDSEPQEVLAWAFQRFGGKIAIASSFGVEDVVLIDMAADVLGSELRVFTLDTGRLHQATYDLMDRVRNRYDLRIEVMFPDHVRVESMVREYGINLFYDSVENRKACCRVRKVEPLGRVLGTLDAWVTGLRRDQNVTRTDVPKVEMDSSHSALVKINPLAGWTSAQVWAYAREGRVPYSALHDQGFPSIGCEPCTRPIDEADDPRAGRWWWEDPDTKECGLHLKG